MYKLRSAIQDPSVLIELQPEELGAKILFALRSSQDREGSARSSFHINNEVGSLFGSNAFRYTQTSVDPWDNISNELRQTVELAIVEAWAWLRAQGLMVPKPGGGDWEVLSRRAQMFESPDEFAKYATARLLPRELLHPLLGQRVWLAFMRGDFDAAVFYATKAVEVSVRKAAGLSDDLVGTTLMRRAFSPEGGPLTDLSAEGGERQARSDLFAGAIGSYKNPQSHREVNLEDSTRALELVMLANHLLAIVDLRVVANQRRESQ